MDLDLRFGFGMSESSWGTIQEVYYAELRFSFVGRGKFVNQTWGVNTDIVSVLALVTSIILVRLVRLL